MAAPPKRELPISDVVGSLPLIYQANVGQIHNQINNWRWDNPRALGDHVVHSNPKTTTLGMVKLLSKRFTLYSSNDLRANIKPPRYPQYKPVNFLAIRPLNWDEIINDNDEDAKWADPGAPSSGRSHLSDENDNDNGEGEHNTQGGEIRTGKEKGTNNGMGKGNGKGKGQGKAMEEGKGKGNSKGKGIVQQTPGGDDISHAISWKLQKKMYNADPDMEGYLERV
jgi:hypothetical protein